MQVKDMNMLSCCLKHLLSWMQLSLKFAGSHGNYTCFPFWHHSDFIKTLKLWNFSVGKKIKRNSAALVSLSCYLYNKSDTLLLRRSDSIDIFPIIPKFSEFSEKWRYNCLLCCRGGDLSLSWMAEQGQWSSERSHIVLDLLVQLERNRKPS